MWLHTSLYTLFADDRSLLLSPTAWLNDRVVCATQSLLQKQSSIPGFQDTILGMTLCFEIQRSEFIQILHDGHNHWFTISNIGCKSPAEFLVYDSMYSSVGHYSKKQIAALLCSKEKEVRLKMMDVQKQSGGYDCGLFAIGFATALASGIPPGQCTFKQELMRKHLYACLGNSHVSMFPSLKPRRQVGVVKSEDFIPLYCTWRMPEIPPMVECSHCNEWYHTSCIDVPKEALDNSEVD